MCVVALAWLVAAGGAYSQDGRFFPVDDLREGMRGVGLTVFSGTRIEEFDVEIIGVLRNSGPRQDMVLARLSGGRLAETGVLQGMSGSPVYVDGRLVGAIAFAFESSTEPIAGIQPIGQMVSVLDTVSPAGPPPGGLPSESVASFVYRSVVGSGERGPEPDPRPLGRPGSDVVPSARAVGGMRPIATPLAVSGVSAAAVSRFSGALQEFGFNPVQGGGTGAFARPEATGAGEVVPGTSINAEMVRGDISVSANGTVTWVDGDKVYAFGHPFQSTGPVDLPMSLAHVITIVPTRAMSFKVAVPTDVVGHFEQDRSTGILGRVGRPPDMIPVRVDVETSREAATRYEYEVINDRFMTPLMMNLTLFELILATERSLGDLTLEVSGEVHLRSGETVRINAAFAGETNSQAQTAVATSAPISYLLATGLEELAIESIDLTLRSTDSRRLARLDGLRVDRNEVRAGETVTLEAVLRTPEGETIVQEFELRIPDGLAPGRLELVAGDGLSVTGADIRRVPSSPPRDTAQIIRDLNGLRRMDRLYVRILSSEPGVVVGGAEMPSLPPSMMALVRSDRATDSEVTGISGSPVAEFEIGPSDYVIQGQRTLELRVVR